MNRLLSFLRSAHSMDRAFVVYSLQRQLQIAKMIRDLDDRPRVLFDRSFAPVSTKVIGCYRVSVDGNGREAVLLEGAQKSFNATYYLSFFPNDPDVCQSQEVVTLREIGSSTTHNEAVASCESHKFSKPD